MFSHSALFKNRLRQPTLPYQLQFKGGKLLTKTKQMLMEKRKEKMLPWFLNPYINDVVETVS